MANSLVTFEKDPSGGEITSSFWTNSSFWMGPLAFSGQTFWEVKCKVKLT